MKIIDKLIIIMLGFLFGFSVGWKNPVTILGAIPIIYSVGYLVYKGANDD